MRPARSEVREELFAERFQDQFEAVPEGTAPPGDDRIQDRLAVDVATALALTLGEPAGIGPDITLAAWRRRRRTRPAAVLSGRAIPRCLARRAARLGLDVPIEIVDPGDAAATSSRPPCRWSRSASRSTAEPGQPDATSAPAAIAVDPPRRRRRARRRGRRGRHQSDRQERALPPGLRRARPHRISRQARRASTTGDPALAGDDAVVAGARGGAGHHPSAAAGRAAAADRAT